MLNNFFYNVVSELGIPDYDKIEIIFKKYESRPSVEIIRKKIQPKQFCFGTVEYTTIKKYMKR